MLTVWVKVARAPRRRASRHRGRGGRSSTSGHQSRNRGCLAQAQTPCLGQQVQAPIPQIAARPASLAPRAGPAQSRLRLAAASSVGPRPRAAGCIPVRAAWHRLGAQPPPRGAAGRHARPPRRFAEEKSASRHDPGGHWQGEREIVDQQEPHRVLPTIGESEVSAVKIQSTLFHTNYPNHTIITIRVLGKRFVTT